MTDREAEARLRKYIAEYEDAPTWGGPTMYPAPPSVADLKLLLSRTEATTGVGGETRWAKPIEAKHADGCEHSHCTIWLCDCPRPIIRAALSQPVQESKA